MGTVATPHVVEKFPESNHPAGHWSFDIGPPFRKVPIP